MKYTSVKVNNFIFPNSISVNYFPELNARDILAIRAVVDKKRSRGHYYKSKSVRDTKAREMRYRRRAHLYQFVNEHSLRTFFLSYILLAINLYRPSEKILARFRDKSGRYKRRGFWQVNVSFLRSYSSFIISSCILARQLATYNR